MPHINVDRMTSSRVGSKIEKKLDLVGPIFLRQTRQDSDTNCIVPDGQIKGAVVLLPGTFETTEHLISSYCGGTPSAVQGKYIYYSCYSHSQGDGQQGCGHV